MNRMYSDSTASGVSDLVVRAVADHLEVDPSSLEPPLYDVVDPDALDALFEGAPAPTVSFQYRDVWVVVRPDCSVVVTEDRPEVPAP